MICVRIAGGEGEADVGRDGAGARDRRAHGPEEEVGVEAQLPGHDGGGARMVALHCAAGDDCVAALFQGVGEEKVELAHL